MARNHNRIAIIRSALPEKIILHPNEGYMDGVVDHPTTSAIIQESEESSLPSHLEITPAVIQHKIGVKAQEVMVTLSNISTEVVVIAPKCILCEIHPVAIAEEVLDTVEQSSTEEIMNGVAHR